MILSQDGIKRKLADKPYLLILSRDEARALVKQLQDQGATDDSWNYGCITIYPFSWCDTPSSTPPLEWIAR
jgi:hypothetical protein